MLTVNELFAGIGSQRAALERLGIEHKVVGIAEIDKFAIKSYEAIWGPTKNYGDIGKVKKLDYADFWTYSFPCQDISIAGKQEGISKHTRSGLLYEVERLLEKSNDCGELPKYLMLENVKNLVGKKFKPQFVEWIQRLDELGFNTYWQVLNAKHYGIPQNRERVFGISIRKDIDTGYVFPEPFELKIRLKDVLEKEVDEKFYINNDRMNVLLKNLETSKLQKDSTNVNQIGNCVESKGSFKNPQRGRVYSENGCSPALNCVGGGGLEPKILQVGNVSPSGKGMNGNVFNQDGLSPTITTNKGEGLKILEPTGIDKSVNNPRVIESANCITSREDRGISNRKSEGTAVIEPVIAASRGRNPNNPSDRTPGSPTEQRLEVNQKGTSNTITTVQKDNYVLEPNNEVVRIAEVGNGGQGERVYSKEHISPALSISHNGRDALIEQCFRIRKLTPLECWRLMGFRDEQFQKAQDAGVSNTQLYKQAGNSIVVDVLYYLFKNLFIDSPTEKIEPESELPGQMSIMDYL